MSFAEKKKVILEDIFTSKFPTTLRRFLSVLFSVGQRLSASLNQILLGSLSMHVLYE